MPGTMTIDDYQQAGELFIRLAKGQIAVPANTQAAIELLQHWGVSLQNYDHVVFHVDTPNTLHLVVRRKDLIETTHEAVNDPGTTYTFPPGVETFYALQFAGGENEKPPKGQLFQFRIGDYSLGQCA